MSRRPEQGSAILITLLIIMVLLAGGAVLVGMQMQSSRSTDLARNGLSSLYCAEAGLSAARPIVAANYAGWNASLGQPTEPGWLAAIDHDIDDDGSADFIITLKDNDDEQSPLPNDLTLDNDLKVFIVATCTKYPDIPKQVSELVLFNGGGGCYQSQLGGCGGNGNNN